MAFKYVPARKKDNVTFSQTLAVADHERLVHHSIRLATHQTELVRQGTFILLNQLDEQEEFYLRRKAEREKKGKGVASMPKHPGGFEPEGLALDRPSPFASFVTKREEEKAASSVVDTRTDAAKKIQADRIKKSFEGYAKYVESAEDTLEQEIRRQKIVDELKMRSLSDALGIEFLELLEKRNFTKIASGIVKLDPSIPVAGDIDL